MSIIEENTRDMTVKRGIKEYTEVFGFKSEDELKNELQNKVVLDAGSGDGNLKKDLGEGFSVTNLDVRHIPGSNSVQAMGESMPFASNNFDIVLCNHSLFLYGQENKGMSLEKSLTQQAQEAYRVLKNDGKLYIILLPVNPNVVPSSDSNFFLYTSFNTNEVAYGQTLKIIEDVGFVIDTIENFEDMDSKVMTTRVILRKPI